MLGSPSLPLSPLFLWRLFSSFLGLPSPLSLTLESFAGSDSWGFLGSSSPAAGVPWSPSFSGAAPPSPSLHISLPHRLRSLPPPPLSLVSQLMDAQACEEQTQRVLPAAVLPFIYSHDWTAYTHERLSKFLVRHALVGLNEFQPIHVEHAIQ